MDIILYFLSSLVEVFLKIKSEMSWNYLETLVHEQNEIIRNKSLLDTSSMVIYSDFDSFSKTISDIFSSSSPIYFIKLLIFFLVPLIILKALCLISFNGTFSTMIQNSLSTSSSKLFYRYINSSISRHVDLIYKCLLLLRNYS